MPSRNLLPITMLCVVLASSSCAGSLYKVKPALDLPPLPENVKSTSAGGVSLRVAPLMSDEDTQDLFEVNLPLSGVLAVRVELVFESGVPVEIKRARFRLREGGGK